jgi:hypothetical protein
VTERGVLINWCGAVAESSRIIAPTRRLRLISMRGMEEAPLRWNSGDFLADDHSLDRERNLHSPGRAKRSRNREAMENLKHAQSCSELLRFQFPLETEWDLVTATLRGCNIQAEVREIRRGIAEIIGAQRLDWIVLLI